MESSNMIQKIYFHKYINSVNHKSIQILHIDDDKMIHSQEIRQNRWYTDMLSAKKIGYK